MELKDIYEIWDRFERSQVSEMELDFQGVHFKLSQNAVTNTTAVAMPDAVVPVSQNTVSECVTVEKSSTVADTKKLEAPLVGVFYRCPAPGEAAFVEVGDHVKKGDVVGIIEAMKMMNEILAPEEGTVEEILAGDGELVEYHQTILTYR